MKNEFHVSVDSPEPKVISRPATLEGLESRQLKSATAHIKGEVFAAGHTPEQFGAVELSLQYAGNPQQDTNAAPSWQVEQGIIAILRKSAANSQPAQVEQGIIAILRKSGANSKPPQSSLKIDGIRDAVITIRKAGGVGF